GRAWRGMHGAWRQKSSEDGNSALDAAPGAGVWRLAPVFAEKVKDLLQMAAPGAGDVAPGAGMFEKL
ncbi:hypothetical protein A2U01_0026608, partial [Trifolium medium]|nr:hypothetical protein [Trifolium medium]